MKKLTNIKFLLFAGIIGVMTSCQKADVQPVVPNTVTTPVQSTVVAQKPIITGQSTLTAGSSITLNASISAKGFYQWQLDGVSIDGANTSAITVAKPGHYVVITDPSSRNGISDTFTVVMTK